jgi:hypothetical protein
MGTVMNWKIVFALIPAFFLNAFTVSGHGPMEKEVSDLLESFSFHTKPQKVYLHLDKPGYTAGETIWFKAYLFDGAGHNLDTGPNNLYVELINAMGNSVDMRIIKAEDGIARGDISLREGLPDGNYFIKAYTDWMKNFSEDQYYTKYVYIENPDYENVIPRREVRRNKRFNRSLERKRRDYEITFFPESGILLAGTTNRVAFKVADGLGSGQKAEGEIIDDSGNVIATVSTGFSGIGVFEIEPEFGGSYSARMSVNGGRSRHYELPQASEEGFMLRIDQDGHQLGVSIISMVGQDNPLFSKDLILIGHTRGRPHYDSTFHLPVGRMDLTIDKELFPTGIAHFTVLTSKYVPVAERLIFINRNDELSFDTSITTSREIGKDYINMIFTVTNGSGEPVEGSFSLSAVTNQNEPGLKRDNIMSYMLLSSELDGMVENPMEYLYADPEKDILADHLLLTHEWRRFKWGNLISGKLPEFRAGTSPGLSLTGRVYDPAKNESLNNYPVQLTVKSGHDDVFTTRTARNGNFVFEGLNYEGLVDVTLSSRRLPANYPPVLELNIEEGREFKYEPGIYTMEKRITSRGDDWKRVRGISLAHRGRLNERHVTPQLYGTPDQTIFIDYATTTDRSLLDVLRSRATGLSYEGGQIVMRGPTSIFLSNEARFMVDGIFVNRDDLLNLYPRDVERIEIFRGPRAAIFGIRGGNGVIIAYTRRPGYGGFEDALELVMLGYHTAGEFKESPVPVSGNSNGENMESKTIYWDPNLVSGSDGRLNVRFPVSGGMGKIRITLEGVGFEQGIGGARFYIELMD